MSFDSIVERDHVQNIQQLPFVLVDSFDLHVEHRHGIDLLMLRFQKPFSQSMLVLLFDLLNVAHEGFVVDEFFQAFEFVERGDPAFADFLRMNELDDRFNSWGNCTHFGNGIAQIRIAQNEPSARCDTVRLILELVRRQLVERLEAEAEGRFGDDRNSRQDLTALFSEVQSESWPHR